MSAPQRLILFVMAAVCLLAMPAQAGFRLWGDGCVVAGCSQELCTDADDGPTASVCMVEPSYACYAKLSACKRQPDGQCGWTPTPELERCIAEAKASTAVVVPTP